MFLDIRSPLSVHIILKVGVAGGQPSILGHAGPMENAILIAVKKGRDNVFGEGFSKTNAGIQYSSYKK